MGPDGPDRMMTGRWVFPSEVFGAREAFHCRGRERVNVCETGCLCDSPGHVKATVRSHGHNTVRDWPAPQHEELLFFPAAKLVASCLPRATSCELLLNGQSKQAFPLGLAKQVPGLFLQLLPLLLLLLLPLLQLHALLQAAASPHAALQPAVTTSPALGHQELQFGCSRVT